MKEIDASVVMEIDCTLGEGPLWHPIHAMLYWADVERREVHGYELHTGLHRGWPAGKRVSAIIPAKTGDLLLGLQGEVGSLDVRSGRVTRFIGLESAVADNRCNDGKCDPAGRLWIGTMQIDAKEGAGSLYCIDEEMNVTRALQNLTIANGMGWSPAGDRMYFIDSADRNVRAFPFSPGSTSLRNPQIILTFEGEAMPDGMCVDAEGMLWIAMWGAGCVRRYDPQSGEQLAEVRVPAVNVTSCCFGGQDLDVLFVTTARKGLSDRQLKDFPLSGSLFRCDPEVKGMQANVFGLRHHAQPDLNNI